MKRIELLIPFYLPIQRKIVSLPWPGYSLGNGLAVCRTPYLSYYDEELKALQHWQVVHEDSGREIARGFRRRKDAVAFAEAIAALFDFTRPAEELIPELGKRREEIRELARRYHGRVS